MKEVKDLDLKINNIFIDNHWINKEFYSIHDLEVFLIGYIYGVENR